MEFRPIDWKLDESAIRNLDTAYTTDRVYGLRMEDLSFSLIEETRIPPITKRYEVTITQKDVGNALVAIAACEGAVLFGFAAVKEEAWNRRAVLTDFYIQPGVRRRGLGRKMMEEVFLGIAEASARVLWVETQNVNLPAIEFYRSVGFEVCGFDSSLYGDPHSKEVAVYLSKSVQKPEPNYAAHRTLCKEICHLQSSVCMTLTDTSVRETESPL